MISIRQKCAQILLHSLFQNTKTKFLFKQKIREPAQKEQIVRLHMMLVNSGKNQIFKKLNCVKII